MKVYASSTKYRHRKGWLSIAGHTGRAVTERQHGDTYNLEESKPRLRSQLWDRGQVQGKQKPASEWYWHISHRDKLALVKAQPWEGRNQVPNLPPSTTSESQQYLPSAQYYFSALEGPVIQEAMVPV